MDVDARSGISCHDGVDVGGRKQGPDTRNRQLRPICQTLLPQSNRLTCFKAFSPYCALDASNRQDVDYTDVDKIGM